MFFSDPDFGERFNRYYDQAEGVGWDRMILNNILPLEYFFS